MYLLFVHKPVVVWLNVGLIEAPEPRGVPVPFGPVYQKILEPEPDTPPAAFNTTFVDGHKVPEIGEIVGAVEFDRIWIVAEFDEVEQPGELVETIARTLIPSNPNGGLVMVISLLVSPVTSGIPVTLIQSFPSKYCH